MRASVPCSRAHGEFRFLIGGLLWGFAVFWAAPQLVARPGETSAGEARITLDEGPIRRMIEESLVHHKIPGYSVGVVLRSDLVFGGGFGLCDVESNRPATVDTGSRALGGISERCAGSVGSRPRCPIWPGFYPCNLTV